jgi:hypothetical protein
MAFMFHRGLAIPLWAIALSAIALTLPSHLLPSFTVLLAVAVIASMMMVMVRWFGTRPTVAVLPVAGRHTRPAGLVVNIAVGAMGIRTSQPTSEVPAQESTDVLDLVHMDDDGGWQVALEPSLTGSRLR